MSTISQVEVLVSSPGRNFVTVRITTSDGVTGLGDATVNGREMAVVAYLREHVAPLLLGRDPDAIESTWNYLYRGAYWRRGPITMAAIAGVDMALWDILARSCGRPLYQLLGGASRDGLLAYGHASGADLPAIFDSIARLRERGFRAVRVQSNVPGLGDAYGVASGTTSAPTYGDAQRPAVEQWDTRAYLRHVPGVFEAVRSELGPELILLHDAHHRLTPNQAGRLGQALEPYDLFWLEDCTPAENPEGLRRVRSMTGQPLAIGEVFNTVWDYPTIITEQLVDYVRSAATHAGGISHLKRIVELAALYQIKSAFHGPEDISPVGQAAHLHLGLAVHSFGIQEFSGYTDLTLEVFRTSFTFLDGLLHPGETPGLGVEYDDDAAAAHPYRPSYLPVNRLLDGTVHDW